MKPEQVISGQRRSWSVVRKMGEGDAGEIYLIKSLLDNNSAVLKRPQKSAFFSDVLRQARQIKSEGVMLQGLGRISFANRWARLTVPALIDQNPGDQPPGEQTFIVIEPAPGLDLQTLRQIIRSSEQIKGEEYSAGFVSPQNNLNRFFSSLWQDLDVFPEALLTRLLLGIIELLETIHHPPVRNEQVRQFGIIWNDIKAEHIFWDPTEARMTIIDWGNSQLLKEDGTTKDRQFSFQDDYIQFINEMGRFVVEVNPDFYKRLNWPVDVLETAAAEQTVFAIKENLLREWEAAEHTLKGLRSNEMEIYATSTPTLAHLKQAADLWRPLAQFGELPDLASLAHLYNRAALSFASSRQLDDFREVCRLAAELPSIHGQSSGDRWQVLKSAAALPFLGSSDLDVIASALASGATGDWAGMLWSLFSWVGENPLPEWWASFSTLVRRTALNLEADSLPPYVTVSRSLNLLQMTSNKPGEPPRIGINERFRVVQPEPIQEDFLHNLDEDLLSKWMDLEPSPPNAGLLYSEFDLHATEIETSSPDAWAMIEKALVQPRAQVDLVLSAWERKDFDLAQKALRQVLIWDPDRRRLLIANRLIGTARAWLDRLHKGAQKDEPFYEYLTSVEMTGRELRSRVGPARWLDSILEVLKRLRKGARSVDLTIDYPDVQREIPWLNEYRSREILSLPRNRTLTLDRDPGARLFPRTISGVVEDRFGQGRDFCLGPALDTWLPEAQGSSARVFAGLLRGEGRTSARQQQYAIKIMRPNRLDYAIPLFKEEVRLLTLLRDVPGISPLVECGFLKLDEGLEIPGDHSGDPADKLQGQIIRYASEEALNFLGALDRQTSIGWLPYLALVERKSEHNLMQFCDSAYTHGWYLPLKEGVLLAIQICTILQTAHERNIAYRDHKILHYYWDPETHGVVMIDWNIARHYPQGLTDADKQFDLVQFGARALHHILTGRPAPGSLPLGPNRPEDIEHAAARYAANWTYDDERLPNQLKAILEQTLNQGYTQARDLRQDLVEIYERI